MQVNVQEIKALSKRIFQAVGVSAADGIVFLKEYRFAP